jgi:hypothetical protein
MPVRHVLQPLWFAGTSLVNDESLRTRAILTRTNDKVLEATLLGEPVVEFSPVDASPADDAARNRR